MNLEKLLTENGWQETHASKGKYYQYSGLNNGWFGCTSCNPQVCFNKGSRYIIFSLQGELCASVPYIYRLNIPNFIELAKSNLLKGIFLTINGHIVYYSLTGILPNQQLITDFITKPEANFNTVAPNPYLPALITHYQLPTMRVNS